MSIYRVTIVATVTRTVEVTARSDRIALKKAHEVSASWRFTERDAAFDGEVRKVVRERPSWLKLSPNRA